MLDEVSELFRKLRLARKVCLTGGWSVYLLTQKNSKQPKDVDIIISGEVALKYADFVKALCSPPLNYYKPHHLHELTFKKPVAAAARSDSDLSVDLMVDSVDICKFPVWWSNFGDSHVRCFYHLAFFDRIEDSNSPLPYSGVASTLAIKAVYYDWLRKSTQSYCLPEEERLKKLERQRSYLESLLGHFRRTEVLQSLDRLRKKLSKEDRGGAEAVELAISTVKESWTQK